MKIQSRPKRYDYGLGRYVSTRKLTKSQKSYLSLVKGKEKHTLKTFLQS